MSMLRVKIYHGRHRRVQKGKVFLIYAFSLDQAMVRALNKVRVHGGSIRELKLKATGEVLPPNPWGKEPI